MRLLGPIAVIFLLLGTSVGSQPALDPVYVGARVCATCHDGPEIGHQFSKWVLSKHGKAYAALALPEAKRIARLSGITEEPQEAALCLGCHATAADTEDWERDAPFLIEDGVQCERCHGPGSEYIDAEVMANRQAALAAGLKIPEKGDCRVCHHEKGSHDRVLGSPTWRIETAWAEIAHPRTRQPDQPEESFSSPITVGQDGPQFVGVHTCGECHSGSEMGFQFSRWRLSGHSLAYARLSTPRAYEIAKEQGVTGIPQSNQACLRCHSTNGNRLGGTQDSFSPLEGVGCEACHGPGSQYMADAVMVDRERALEAGLELGRAGICVSCHPSGHGEEFDFETASRQIQHPTQLPQLSQELRYKTPLNLALSPDGKELYVTCEASNSVIVVDVMDRRKVAEIAVGGQPHDVTFSPNGTIAYVSNRLDDTVSVIDVSARRVVKTVEVGDEPHGLLTDRTGERLFVLNTAEDNISVFSTSGLTEIKRLTASRNPWSLSLSPDGTRLLVTNTLSRLVGFREPLLSEITGIELERGRVDDRLTVPDANLLQGIAWHPSGEFALITLTRTKNLIPMTRLLQGWTVTNGLGIAWKDGRVDQVLLDEPNVAFPDPADVAFSPDGQLAFVTSSGSNRLAVVNVLKLVKILKEASDNERREVFPNHLGKPTEFVIKHIPTGRSPRGILVTPDGDTAFVANALDDSLTVVDMPSMEPLDLIDLGGPKEITKVRLGERLFHSANITFQRQFSCHTCHPDGHVDGITFDIEPDGIGVSPVDNRSLRGILDTAPFKWEGTNPTLQRQCGPRLAVFFTRIQPFTPLQLSALESYIATIPRPPNRYRPLGALLSPAQRRGKSLFERTRTNQGGEVPKEKRCITCHPPPLYTNHQVVDVGTKTAYDREHRFDIPHLNNIYDSAPYLHNGIAKTLEEIWTVYNPNDLHGVTNDLTKDQLNDLIEYIKTF